MFRSRAAQTTILAAGSTLALITATAGDRAHAEGNLDANYTISFARIPVGEITATAVFGQNEYAISARARAGVLKALLVDGEASFSTDGTIKGDYPVPTTFTSKVVSNAESSDVTMVLEEGNVKELVVTPPPSSDLVAVTNANRQGIVDPLTALLFSAAAAGEGLSQEACRRTLPIFDGHQRYDLKLAFKRMDKMTAEKGYAGPVVVRSVNYEPIAGHRANISACQISFRGPRNRDRARTNRRHAPIGAVSAIRCEHARKLSDRGQSIRNDYGACTRGHAPIAHPVDTSSMRRDGVLIRCVRVHSGLFVCQ